MALTDKLSAIGDAIRTKTGKSDSLTLEQMATEIDGIEITEELPKAEEAIFGKEDDADIETGIVTLGTINFESLTRTFYPFNKYTAREPLSIIGLRIYVIQNPASRTLSLWNANGERVRKTEQITPSVNTWTNAYFDEPVNIAMGESFAISASGAYYPTSSDASNTTINAKVSFDGSSEYDYDSFPSTFRQYKYWGIVDFLIGPARAELPDDYQITRTTMDDIAEEVQRITGETGKLSTAQIQDGLESVILQEKSVTPTAEPQEVVPDSGYYGMSKVVVGACPPPPEAEDSLVAYLNNTLTEYSSEEVTRIPAYAFSSSGSGKMASVNLPNVVNIGINAFHYNGYITELNFPKATKIEANAFQQMTKATSITVPAATSIGNYAFASIGITEIDLPNLTTVSQRAFNSCRSLTSVNIPEATRLNQAAFCDCRVLTAIDLPKVTYMEHYAFQACSTLTTVILRSETLCSLQGITVFQDTPFASGGSGGVVYVPGALLESYKTATNWSALFEAGSLTFAAIEGSVYQ